MRHRLDVVLPSVLSLVLSACSDPARDLQSPPRTDVPPAALIDLGGWSLTLPVDSKGGTTGYATVVTTDELLQGYQSDWFYGTEDEGVTFWAPVTGARTEHSRFARSELRELLDPANPAVNWSWTDTAEMTAEVAVHQAPSANGKVVIGQILGYNGDNPNISELAKLIFEYNANSGRATVYGLIMDTPFAGAPARTLLLATDGFRLSQRFTYSIRVEDRMLHLSAGPHTVSTAISPSWEGVGIYYRAGVMPYAQGTSPADGARATFYALKVEHGQP